MLKVQDIKGEKRISHILSSPNNIWGKLVHSLKAETKPWHNTGAGSWRINYACCVFLNWILPAWSAAFRLSAGSLQKRGKTRQEALKKAQRNALKENSGWEVKLVKLPTASLCRRRVYTDFPALRGGEKSFPEHEKQKTVWKSCSLWTISSQIIFFKMRQNKGRNQRNHWEQSEGMYLEESVNKRVTKSWEYKNKLMGTEETPFCLLKTRIGNGRAGRFSHHRIYPKDRIHFCFIITSQQELENIQVGLVTIFFKIRS